MPKLDEKVVSQIGISINRKTLERNGFRVYAELKITNREHFYILIQDMETGKLFPLIVPCNSNKIPALKKHILSRIGLLGVEGTIHAAFTKLIEYLLDNWPDIFPDL